MDHNDWSQKIYNCHYSQLSAWGQSYIDSLAANEFIPTEQPPILDDKISKLENNILDLEDRIRELEFEIEKPKQSQTRPPDSPPNFPLPF